MPGALVTGGASGLGFAISRALVERGFEVWIADIDEGAAAAAAAQLGPRARPLWLDVADRAACDSAAAAVTDLAVWVNNAGILRTRPSWEHPADEVAAMFAVNTTGLINGTLAALAVFRARRRGHVINIISLAGLVAPPGETVYAATKHAALAFSTGTLLDLRAAGVRDVHISSVCPDGIWTPMLYDKVDDPQAAPSWSGVMFRPEQVAARAMTLIDRPRPILVLPRWRGALVRTFDAFPRLGLRLAPLVMADARRKQRAFARKGRPPA
jgi:NAD(P)-dependent dehydrogenase (short-subunit alcohol dehydrogenase family)